MMYYSSAWRANKSRVVLLSSGPRFPNAPGGFFIMKMDDLEAPGAAEPWLPSRACVIHRYVQLWHQHPRVCLMLLALWCDMYENPCCLQVAHFYQWLYFSIYVIKSKTYMKQQRNADVYWCFVYAWLRHSYFLPFINDLFYRLQPLSYIYIHTLEQFLLEQFVLDPEHLPLSEKVFVLSLNWKPFFLCKNT